MRRLTCVAAMALGVVPAAMASTTPNDPAWPAQWAQRTIQVDRVWPVTTGTPNVIIATIDTGVDASTPDLAGALAPGWDFVWDDPIAEDTHGHGTHVASVIAARGNNGIGMAGHCWGCLVMPIRVAVDGAATAGAIARGIRWAVDHGARVINISIARVGPPDPAEQAAVDYAVARNVLVVASAGNGGDEALHSPAAAAGVLAVAGTNERDILYPWSTRGPWVTLAAPGCQMIVHVGFPNGGTLCGTSLAPPAVAGVAGLIFSAAPNLTAREVAWALRASAVPVAGIGGGRVDAYAAFAILGLLPPAQPPVSPTPVPEPAFTRQIRVEKGQLLRTRRLVLRLGAGRIDVELQVTAASTCTLDLRSPDAILLGRPRSTRAVRLIANVSRGRYTLSLSCRTKKAQPYALMMAGMFPSR